MPPIYKRRIRGQFQMATNVITKMQYNLRFVVECIEILFFEVAVRVSIHFLLSIFLRKTFLFLIISLTS